LFVVAELEGVVRISPKNFGRNLRQVALEALKSRYEGVIIPEIGIIILILDADVNPVGRIFTGDGATYHKVKFNLMAYCPKLHEIVEGEVVEITDFGAFVRVGPIDALLHISQIADEYLTSDPRQGVILNPSKKKVLRVGSRVRVRVNAVSLSREDSIGRIGITCRHAYLGAFEWFAEEVKKELAAGAKG